MGILGPLSAPIPVCVFGLRPDYRRCRLSPARAYPRGGRSPSGYDRRRRPLPARRQRQRIGRGSGPVRAQHTSPAVTFAPVGGALRARPIRTGVYPLDHYRGLTHDASRSTSRSHLESSLFTTDPSAEPCQPIGELARVLENARSSSVSRVATAARNQRLRSDLVRAVLLKEMRSRHCDFGLVGPCAGELAGMPGEQGARCGVDEQFRIVARREPGRVVVDDGDDVGGPIPMGMLRGDDNVGPRSSRA